MSNKYLIPDAELTVIRSRDKACVYCGKEMLFPYDRTNGYDSATIEHLSPDPPYYWPEMTADNIAYCCGACNSSRGAKHLADWFETSYCKQRGICADSVAEPVQAYLSRLAAATSQQ